MIAYNRQYLDNRDVREDAAEALRRKIISSDEYTRIKTAYPDQLYTPNFFIRVGLFLLTALAASCCLGLFVEAASSGNSMGILMIFFGIISFVVLELFIRVRGIHNAGIDDALLWTGTALILGGINLVADHIPPSVESLLTLLLCAWGVLRYADRVMAWVAYGALLSLIFYNMTGWGSAAFNILPFVVMTISIGCYFLFTRLADIASLRHYRSCLIGLRVATLLSFYLAGNEYVIRTLHASLSRQSGPIALGWLWWILTLGTPIVYIIRGIRRKDVIFLWTGMALTAAAVFTFRYYYHIMSTELAMIIAGTVLLTLAWWLTSYLRTPKHGFTSAAPDQPHVLEKLPIEGLILAETFKAVSSVPSDQPGTRFGGGSGGGAGASGDF
jgi:hypothetical protein